jgi:uncharacterized integral membrane protein
VEGQPPPPPEKKGTPWTLIGLGLLGIYALLLLILNDEKVKIRFVFFTAETRKLVLIILCLGIGFVAGLLFDNWRARRRRRASGE